MEAGTPILQGQSVGPFALGASLYDVLVRVKSQPSIFPKLDLVFSKDHPLSAPIAIRLPSKAITLRFDAREQRLRYIEVLDFTKMTFTYKGYDIVRVNDSSATNAQTPPNRGPTFRTVYKLFGPTTPGEYIPPLAIDSNTPATGRYCLSYPGISFIFPLEHRSWSSDVSWSTMVSVLSSSATSPAQSMCIFFGESWQKSRGTIYTADLPFPRTSIFSRSKDTVPKEIDYVKVHGKGRLEVIRTDTVPFWITLGETSYQDLVTELGPPDSIYRTFPKRSIHRDRADSQSTSRRPSSNSATRPGNLTADYELTSQDGSSNDEDEVFSKDQDNENIANDNQHVWYNYFHHGLDVLLGDPTLSEKQNPTLASRNSPTVMKVMLHGNVPGSWQFNRHRRVRWSLASVAPAVNDGSLASELLFPQISAKLKVVYKSAYTSPEAEKTQQQPMALNRGWGNGESLAGSVELLGEWEDSSGGRRKRSGDESDGGSGLLGSTELYGFPGMIFEVLRSGAVSDLLLY